jgi:hypothetical protein
VAGLAQGLDTSGSTPNERVYFEYRALGDIKKESEKQVTPDDLVPVSLRLVIETVAASPQEIYNKEITTGCTLKAKLQKAGEKAKLRLKCDVGEFMSGFPFANESEAATVRGHVTNAFPKQGSKHIKVDTSKGKIRITNNGEAVDSSNVDVSCSVGSPG